jgi:hypothetical protein
MGKKQASGLWQDKNYVNGWKRDWLNRHPELKDRRKRIMRQQRADFVEALEIEMGGACHRCGYSACLAALDLHHVNSQEKTNTVSDLAARRKWDAARLEADKCVPLCANCHREYEHGLWVGEFAKRDGIGYTVASWELTPTWVEVTPFMNSRNGKIEELSNVDQLSLFDV